MKPVGSANSQNQENQMVRTVGIEPTLSYENKILSLACLPVPPRPHSLIHNR